MTRRKHRGQRLTGLFTWQADNQTVPDQDRDNPLTRQCGHCHAGIGQPCTSRRGTRLRKSDYHDSRTTPQEQT